MSPISKKKFILMFMTLAFIFVPVRAQYFMVGFTVPTIYIFIEGLFEFSFFSILSFIQVIIYAALFLGLAFLFYRLSMKCSKLKVRLFFQYSILLLLFSCSFLRVIGGYTMRGPTGTYNFWSAVLRIIIPS